MRMNLCLVIIDIKLKWAGCRWLSLYRYCATFLGSKLSINRDFVCPIKTLYRYMVSSELLSKRFIYLSTKLFNDLLIRRYLEIATFLAATPLA